MESGVAEYLAGLIRCGALVAFLLSPSALKMLCAMAASLGQSGAALGKIGEEAGVKSPTTRANAIKLLSGLGLVEVERACGKLGEVRGTHWQLLAPPTRMRAEARKLVNELIDDRRKRAERIRSELPEDREC